MSYAAQRSTLGRVPVWIVEIDLDYCTRTYGTAPCNAAIGVTGPAKCFNTRKTCQFSSAYVTAPKTYRFSSQVLPPSNDPQFQCIPCVRAVATLPTRIEPGKGLGKRASLTVTLGDFAHSDLGLDPYLSTRGYDSAARGTYWLKLLGRNPYYQGRTLRVRTGYITPGQPPDAADFQTRSYRIEQIDASDKEGNVRIIAKDPLKALDDSRSVAPRASTSVLLAALNTTDGVFTLSPAGVGALEYPASGAIVIDEEVMTFARVGDVLTVSRATNYTLAAAHDLGAPVQLCLSYTAAFITDIIYDLLVNYGGIDPALIDLATWNVEANVWLAGCNLTAVVVKPLGVAKLIAELSEQCQLFIWWDERDQTIGLKAVRPWAFDSIASLNESAHILADSQSVRDRPDERISQVLFYYGQKDPTEDLEKPWNFQRLKVNTDADSESGTQFGDSRIKIIYSRWINVNQVSQAVKVASRTLNRYRNVPRTYTLSLDAKDSDAWTGDVVLVTMRTLVDYTGAALPSYLQVVEAKEQVVGSRYDYVLEDTGFSGRYALWSAPGLPSFPSADDPTRSRYGFWGDASGLMSDGSTGYQWA